MKICDYQYLMTIEKLNAQLLLERVYDPILLMSHRAKLVPQFPKTLSRRQQRIDNLLVDTKPNGFNRLLGNALEKATRVCSTVWGAEKHDADCGVEGSAEMCLA
jgi:hypothetical protein